MKLSLPDHGIFESRESRNIRVPGMPVVSTGLSTGLEGEFGIQTPRTMPTWNRGIWKSLDFALPRLPLGLNPAFERLK